MTELKNVFKNLPDARANEVFEQLAGAGNCKIERIVSQGQTTPAGEWYDQPGTEWVLVLEGEALLEMDNGRQHHLHAGDHITLPAHCRHRVAWTKPDAATIWLAVHYTD
ncbi:cupin domain-containing protein [Simiduia sp. 21SJ11W-1]|uniref:cupin domain-containing protein n=1 Tax=Simiduia sp. 21SJ11W-1 TaxID=2909669 RepID=UPI00209CE80A|nr:cupin domain-containing protein [Simiduia sp. 21SJ11W-1]UTA47599.1 cupin domain-containing protein [Simiduia sp. 21SJ11W-1]